MKFKATQAPSNSDLRGVIRWVFEQLQRLEAEINTVQSVSFVKHASIPAKYQDGDVFYFLEDVVGVGEVEGLYSREAGAWVKL